LTPQFVLGTVVRKVRTQFDKVFLFQMKTLWSGTTLNIFFPESRLLPKQLPRVSLLIPITSVNHKNRDKVFRPSTSRITLLDSNHGFLPYLPRCAPISLPQRGSQRHKYLSATQSKFSIQQLTVFQRLERHIKKLSSQPESIRLNKDDLLLYWSLILATGFRDTIKPPGDTIMTARHISYDPSERRDKMPVDIFVDLWEKRSSPTSILTPLSVGS
jgi:hypothetical protein